MARKNRSRNGRNSGPHRTPQERNRDADAQVRNPGYRKSEAPLPHMKPNLLVPETAVLLAQVGRHAGQRKLPRMTFGIVDSVCPHPYSDLFVQRGVSWTQTVKESARLHQVKQCVLSVEVADRKMLFVQDRRRLIIGFLQDLELHDFEVSVLEPVGESELEFGGQRVAAPHAELVSITGRSVLENAWIVIESRHDASI